jgi:hypothetical protein
MAGGVVSIFGYLLFDENVTAENIVSVVVLAPVFQGLLLMLYGLIGYPLYVYWASRRKFSLYLYPIRSDSAGPGTR